MGTSGRTLHGKTFHIRAEGTFSHLPHSACIQNRYVFLGNRKKQINIKQEDSLSGNPLGGELESTQLCVKFQHGVGMEGFHTTNSSMGWGWEVAHTAKQHQLVSYSSTPFCHYQLGGNIRFHRLSKGSVL